MRVSLRRLATKFKRTTTVQPAAVSVRLKRTGREKVMALVIPAHNEQLVIESTIASAIAAGQPRLDIYVVDDASTDKTATIARRLLGRGKVLTVEHSGKAMAILQAVDYFRLAKKYRWIHIADADGVFGDGYFKTFTEALDEQKYVAATGYVQSLPGGWVSKYRTYEYTIGLEIYRRLQSWFGVISVIPGASSCFSSRIFHELDFSRHTLTEDFDLTLQIHRRKLGKILYIPAARTYTQDPKNYADYVGQIKRWYRGFWQGVALHKIARRAQGVDAYLGYILTETFVCLIEVITLPILAIATGRPGLIAAAFLADFIIFFSFTVWAATLNRRPDILAAFPLFYVLRYTNLVIFCLAFFEVIVFKRFRTGAVGWETGSRRYQVTA